MKKEIERDLHHPISKYLQNPQFVSGVKEMMNSAASKRDPLERLREMRNFVANYKDFGDSRDILAAALLCDPQSLKELYLFLDKGVYSSEFNQNDQRFLDMLTDTFNAIMFSH